VIDPVMERSSSRNKRKDKKNKKRKPSGTHAKKKRAKTADKHDLYQRSVQAADVEAKFFRKTYKQIFGKKAKTLREDFCGTAIICAEWVKKKGAEAWGVDLDEPTLDWGMAHNVAPLKPEQQARVHLVQDDVRTPEGVPQVDIIAAQNFSFFIFRERQQVLEYFRSVREGLKDDGMFLLDMLGGPACMQADEYEEKEVDHPDGDFIYCWEQEKYEPIHRRALYRIHFKFPDGSSIKNAFTYDWRMWTLPDVRELLIEAGFSETFVYWEGADENGEGDGIFKKRESAPADLAWVAYVIAKK
jgi:SAM-dependent methyltransferase